MSSTPIKPHNKRAQVGIIIGRTAAPGKDFLLQLVCSPDQDGEPPIDIIRADAPKKAGGGGNSKLDANKIVLDEDLIVEHAALAAHTLPGGLDVIGVYILCDEKTFQAGHGVVINVLKKVGKEIKSSSSTSVATSALLVLHIDAITAKVSVRELAGAVLKPCEVKQSALLSNMVAIKCPFSVNLHVNLAGNGKQSFQRALCDAIRWHTEHVVSPAITLLNNQPMAAGNGAQPVTDLLQPQTGCGQNSLSVELLPPIGQGLPPTPAAISTSPLLSSAPGRGEYTRWASFTLQGEIDCRAYVHKREPMSAAISALKFDVERTLLARLDVLVEAADSATAVAKAQYDAAVSRDYRSGKPPSQAQLPRHPLMLKVDQVDSYSPVFPRRTFLEWSRGGCCFCDYIVEGEGMSDVVQRMQSLMGEESVVAASFQCEEKAAVGAGAAALLAAGRKKKGRGGGLPSAGSLLGCNAVTLGAAAVAVVAIWATWWS